MEDPGRGRAARQPPDSLASGPATGYPRVVHEPTIILETVHGSRAYGLSGEDSDLDIKGIHVPEPASFLGYRPWPEQAELSPDHVLYDIRKFFRLAVESNPTVLELLFTEESDRRVVTGEGRLLLEHREGFLSRRAGSSFGRYALSQLKRIKTHRRWLLEPPRARPARSSFGLPERTLIPKDQLGAAEQLIRNGRVDEAELTPNFLLIMDRERCYRAAMREWQQYQTWLANRNPKRADLERRFGYDTKHAMHLVRLLRMAIEILSARKVLVRRPDAQELIAIRQGALSFDRLLAAVEGLEGRLDHLVEESPLPEKPDEEAIDRLCVQIVARCHGRRAL